MRVSLRRRVAIPLGLVGLVTAGGLGATPALSVNGSDNSNRVASAQEDEGLQPAPERTRGKGPYNRLVIRGATLIDGTGAAPRGPVDIVILDDRIKKITKVKKSNLNKERPPFNFGREIDATNKIVMPGFIDMHVHGGGPPKNFKAEYPYKLWLAHGVTTVRGVGLASNEFSVRAKERSARNEIAAPRIVNCQRPGSGWDEGDVDSPAKAREWVRWAANHGVDCIGESVAPNTQIMGAMTDAAHKRGMETTQHIGQGIVLDMNAIEAARHGLDTVTHFYGHFNPLKRPGVENWFPPDFNPDDQQMRFSQVADWANKSVPPGSPKWNAYLKEQKKLGTTFDPTFTIYSAYRDVLRMRNAPWHEQYTLPSLWEFYQPAPEEEAHASAYLNWGTEVETAWKHFYQKWFKLVKDYHDMGGRITTGSDSGFIYQTYGFGYINELEMLREAGLGPVEVVQAATQNGAKTLYEHTGRSNNPPMGTVEPGKLADLVIAPDTVAPQVDKPEWRRRGGGFGGLYATGHVRLNQETGEVERVGRVTWTIKDGIVYDAAKLRKDVRGLVDDQIRKRLDTQGQVTEGESPWNDEGTDPPGGVEDGDGDGNGGSENGSEAGAFLPGGGPISKDGILIGIVAAALAGILVGRRRRGAFLSGALPRGQYTAER